MKKIIAISLVLLSTLAACQEHQSKAVKQDKSGNQKMLDIYKLVQNYTGKPWYEIEFSQDACGYEILITVCPCIDILCMEAQKGNESRLMIKF